MLSFAEVAGFLGAGLAGAAYVPQISHLIRAHCSAGISRLAFLVWLVASLLVMTQAIAIRAGVFIFLGTVQIAATTLILIFATKYEGSYCAVHLPPGARLAPSPAGDAALDPQRGELAPNSSHLNNCTRQRSR